MSMVAGVPDNSALETLRMLLAEPDATRRKLDEFTAAQSQAQAVLDLVGPAQEILSIRAKIEEDRQNIGDLLIKAQTQADQTVMQAEATASAVIAEAQKAKQEMADEATAALAAAKETLGRAAAELLANQQARADAQAALDQANAVKASLAVAQAALDSKQAELDQRIGQLEDARASLKLALG